MLAHIPSFGKNPRGPPDVLVYLIPKACQRRSWYLGPEVLGWRMLRLES